MFKFLKDIRKWHRPWPKISSVKRETAPCQVGSPEASRAALGLRRGKLITDLYQRSKVYKLRKKPMSFLIHEILWRWDLVHHRKQNQPGKFRCEFLQVHFLSARNLIFKISNLCRTHSGLSGTHVLKCQRVWPETGRLPGTVGADGLATSPPPRLVDLKRGWQEEKSDPCPVPSAATFCFLSRQWAACQPRSCSSESMNG